MKLIFVVSHSLFLFNVIPGPGILGPFMHKCMMRISMHTVCSIPFDCMFKNIDWHVLMVIFLRILKIILAVLVKSCDWMKLESNLLKQINHSYNNQSWFQILIRHVIYAYIDIFRTNFHRFIFCPSLLYIQVHLYFMKSEPESTRISVANFIIVLTNSFPISQFLFFLEFLELFFIFNNLNLAFCAKMERNLQ